MTREEILNGHSPFDESKNYAVIVLHSSKAYNVYISLFKDDYDDKAAYKVYRERTDGTLEFLFQYWHYGSYGSAVLGGDRIVFELGYDFDEIVKKLNLSLDDFNASSFLPLKLFEFLLK